MNDTDFATLITGGRRFYLADEVDEAIERHADEVERKGREVASSAVAVLTAGCTKHVDLSLAEFVEAGGGECPICAKVAVNRMAADRARAIEAGVAEQARADQLRDRLRACATDLAATRKAGLEAEDEAGRHRATIATLTADLAAARAERDGLAKALAVIAQDQDSGWPEDGPGERVPLHDADEMMVMARAALAALPPKVADDA